MKPTVLQLIDSFNQGGSERQAIQLTRLLIESGRFRVLLASLNPEGVLRSEAEALNLGEITSYPLNSFYDANALLQLRRLVRFMKQSQVDVLHTHDFYTNIFGMAAGKLARLPVRVASRRETHSMRTTAQTRAQRLAYSLATQVVANSEAVKKQLIKEGASEQKINVIYNGLNCDRLCPAPISKTDALNLLGLPNLESVGSKYFVTIVANMRLEVKDYPTFLRAAKLVHDAVPESTFLLAGEGELMPSVQAHAAELGIRESTFFLGRCDHVAELLAVSDVCVLSSKAEGFSNSIIEYMAAARPVVATDVGGAGEAIVEGETGYLVVSGDHEAMAQRIIWLLQNPNQAREIGEQGRNLAKAKFSCTAQLRATEEMYERLLGLQNR